MNAPPDAMPSPERRLTALSVAAVAGVVVQGGTTLAFGSIADFVAGGRVPALPPSAFVMAYLIVGSFIAVPVCLGVGMPLWRLAERAGRSGSSDALWFGLLAGAIIGAVMTGVMVYSSSSAMGRGELFAFAGFCIAGVCAGRVAHFVAFGPGAADRSVLSRGRRAVALSLAAVVGVAVDVLLWQLRPALANLSLDGAFALPSVGFVLLCIVVGSFVAVPLCLIVGLPLWAVAERHGRRSRTDTLWFGLTAGAIVGAIMVLPDVFRDGPWRGGWDALIEFTEYCVSGGCAGLVARRAAFGRAPRSG